MLIKKNINTIEEYIDYYDNWIEDNAKPIKGYKFIYPSFFEVSKSQAYNIMYSVLNNDNYYALCGKKPIDFEDVRITKHRLSEVNQYLFMIGLPKLKIND